MVLGGEEGAVLTGSGEGSVVRIEAPDVTLRGLTIRGSGDKLDKMDSGVFLDKTAHRALVERNHLEGNLFGIYVWGPAGPCHQRDRKRCADLELPRHADSRQ